MSTEIQHIGYNLEEADFTSAIYTKGKDHIPQYSLKSNVLPIRSSRNQSDNKLVLNFNIFPSITTKFFEMVGKIGCPPNTSWPSSREHQRS